MPNPRWLPSALGIHARRTARGRYWPSRSSVRQLAQESLDPLLLNLLDRLLVYTG